MIAVVQVIVDTRIIDLCNDILLMVIMLVVVHIIDVDDWFFGLSNGSGSSNDSGGPYH